MLVLKQKTKAGVLNSFRSVFDSCFFAVLQLILVVTVNMLMVTSLRLPSVVLHWRCRSSGSRSNYSWYLLVFPGLDNNLV